MVTTERLDKQNLRGFTIVELLIVIVVIAILAAISIVAYNGIQQRGRDSNRQSGLANIQKALELYYVDNGQYPPSTSCGSTSINSHWCSSNDNSWSTFQSRITNNFISALPTDPTNTTGINITGSSGYSYGYFSHTSEKCGSQPGQWYMLVYRLEASAQTDGTGSCTSGTALPNYNASERIVAR